MKKLFCSVVCIIFVFLFGLEQKLLANNVDYITVEELQDKEAGTYPVKITYTDKETEETIEEIIYMTVYYPNTIVNTEVGEAIDAMDVLSDQIISGYGQEQYIKMAQVKAWDVNEGTPVAIVSAIVKNVKETTDGKIYTIEFSTQKGTTIQVTFLEMKNQNFLRQTETYIDNFSTLDNQIKDWVYVIITFYLLVPLLFIIIAFFRMIHLVKSTQRLLYKEYDNYK